LRKYKNSSWDALRLREADSNHSNLIMRSDVFRVDESILRPLTAFVRGMMTTLIGAIVLLGCSTDKTKTTTDTKAVTPAQNPKAAKSRMVSRPILQLKGKIVSVNSSLQFVVAEFPVGELPSVNERLSVYRQGQKVGEVKISGPQEETNIVADVTTGEVQAGDEVRRE
jgi:hypothetical protein